MLMGMSPNTAVTRPGLYHLRSATLNTTRCPSTSRKANSTAARVMNRTPGSTSTPRYTTTAYHQLPNMELSRLSDHVEASVSVMPISTCSPT